MISEPTSTFDIDEEQSSVNSVLASHGPLKNEMVDLTEVAPLSDNHQMLLVRARATLLKEVPKNLKKINDPNLELTQRLELISQTMSSLVVPLISEALSAQPNADRSIVFSRILMFLRGVSEQLNKKREIEESDDINCNSAKFQKIFGWFFDVIHKTMEDQKLDPIHINNIFSALHDNFIGWEDRIQKNLKGVSGKALQKIENPFIKDWQKDIKDNPNTGEEDAILAVKGGHGKVKK